MKASTRRSKNTKPPARQPARRRRSDRVLAQALRQALAAKDDHIRDLRILVSNAEETMKRQEALMRMMLEHHFYRPTITTTGSAGAPALKTAGLPVETFTDVATFDEQTDAQLSKEQQEQMDEAQEEFTTIMTEHTGWQQGDRRGHRVSAEEMDNEAA